MRQTGQDHLPGARVANGCKVVNSIMFVKVKLGLERLIFLFLRVEIDVIATM